MQYKPIQNKLSVFCVEEMCEYIGLSRSGYYDFLATLRAHDPSKTKS